MTEIVLGRGLCGNFTLAAGYEWLLTNGIGGFACGTVGDVYTRRYHGLLTAALTPPTGRILLVAKLEISVRYRDRHFALSCNEYADGTIDPQGFLYLQSFHLERGQPVWLYAVADALIEKRLVMPPGCNTTLVKLKVLRGSDTLHFTLMPLCAYRDYHGHSQANWKPEIIELPTGFEIAAFPSACHYRVCCGAAEFITDSVWYWQFKHRLETERGLDDTEDLYRPGYFALSLSEKEQAVVTITAEQSDPDDYRTTLKHILSEQQDWLKHLPTATPDWIRQLARAARQFVVARRQDGPRTGKTIIAGYPWFTDWGRDTMIALPGLTLALGHFDIAADILRTFADYVSAGMLPNRFPERNSAPDYNSVDATLWFIHAVDQYSRYSGDASLAETLYPILIDIVDWHFKGTRYGIRVDPEDGLLTAGEAGMQLTWMDAKIDDWVVTPRIGKCVEINALWYHALMIMAGLAEQFKPARQAAGYRNRALRVQHSFARFWNTERECLYDVIDAGEGQLYADGKRYDERLRPNQLFAVSLPHSPLDPRQSQAVVDLCAAWLLTSFGLRSLATDEPGYSPRYRGGREQRDGAYHQGTVWAWLIGPFIDAHYRVYRDAEKARSFLEPFSLHLHEACLGQVSEIFDADPPFAARGCFAQAWSVGEVLRVWLKYCRSLPFPGNGPINDNPHSLHHGEPSHE